MIRSSGKTKERSLYMCISRILVWFLFLMRTDEISSALFPRRWPNKTVTSNDAGIWSSPSSLYIRLFRISYNILNDTVLSYRCRETIENKNLVYILTYHVVYNIMGRTVAYIQFWLMCDDASRLNLPLRIAVKNVAEKWSLMGRAFYACRWPKKKIKQNTETKVYIIEVAQRRNRNENQIYRKK